MNEFEERPISSPLIDKLMPDSTPEARSRAYENLRRYVAAVLRIVEREQEELGITDSPPSTPTSTIQPTQPKRL